MKYSNIPSAQTVVLHCKERGIKDIVISPGSRNAPLIIGFSEDPFFKCFSIVDERCAAFFALGMAQQQRIPVALVCTSGSALLNYYPAIAEAFYSHIPLVVISADRPSYMVDIGDGQAIRQDFVFEKHIGYSANLGQDLVHATEKMKMYAPQLFTESTVEMAQAVVQERNDAELYKAFGTAYNEHLPIHINVPFEEPLYSTIKEPCVVPAIKQIPKENNPIKNIGAFVDIWNSSKRKMVLIGVNYPNEIERRFLETLAKDLSVIVFTETLSNVHHPRFFPSIDSIIVPIEKSKDRDTLFKKLQPEVLLTFGGLIVSKKIKAFLRQYKPKHHWHVGENRADNTFFSLTMHFNQDKNTFLSHFLEYAIPVKGSFFDFWSSAKGNYETRRNTYMGGLPFSDMSVFGTVTQGIPKNYQLHLANSSTVRYTQLFDMDPSIRVFCNRGTSGIEGSTSTALGAAVYSGEPTLLLTGDLSFFYDSNGLWNNYIRPDFRIIVINNGGGGIFRILPGKESTENFETYFETKHSLNAAQLCKMYGIDYQFADNTTDLNTALTHFYATSDVPKLLEVRTPRLLNDKILLGYFDFIS